ncbi:L,D-transpeptidase [Mycobacterium sp.]|uniref:L,D-transpeptidase n=1 Tax=Mycobacterium sp. TaxID=1785 RepID=UPI003A8885F9
MRAVARHLFVVLAAATMVAAGSGSPATGAVPVPHALPDVASIFPAPGSVVGVATPVEVTFSAPVVERHAAERAIRIDSPNNVTGHFQWENRYVVRWIPDTYWAPHSRISVGIQQLTEGFETGDALLAVADISAHTFTVSRNGEILRVMPASMGKPSRPTPIGNFSALSKENSVVMDSRTIGIPLTDPDGYKLTAYYAIRVTWSGVYVHSAPWSVGSQGYANVSHGCINLSPDNASWYFNQVNIGDPINVIP